MVARLGRRPHLGALALVILAVLLSWGYLTCVATVAYSYAWWGMGPSMQWATPSGAAAGLPAAAAAASPRAEADLPVPKLLHQTWKTHEVPEVWKAAQKSCIDLHPDYEYKLWTDGDAIKLIEVGSDRSASNSQAGPTLWRTALGHASREMSGSGCWSTPGSREGAGRSYTRPTPRRSPQEHYPWFLPTFLAYPYSIQRVDAIRYFLLYHHGGIYIDLDMGCRARLDFLRVHNFTAPLTYPVGISNDILAARPGDLYLGRAIHQLRRWNKWMVIKYVQVRAGGAGGGGCSYELLIHHELCH